MNRRYHLIIDATNVEKAKLWDDKFIKKLIQDIANLIDMKILFGVKVVEGLPENPGLSAIAIIDFSSIVIHTFTEDNEFCLDVFSCKPFNAKKLYNFIKVVFKLNDSDLRDTSGIVEYSGLEKI